MIRVGFLLLLCTGAFAHNQLPGFEGCPKIIPTQNFNFTKVLGRWFETQKFVPFPEAGRCVTVTYSLNSDGSLQIILSRIRLENMEPVNIEGTAIFLRNTNGPKYVANFPKLKRSITWTLGTDYRHYYIGLSCADISLGNAVNVFVLQKKRKTTAAIFEKICEVFKHYKLNMSALSETDQDNCPATYWKH